MDFIIYSVLWQYFVTISALLYLFLPSLCAAVFPPPNKMKALWEVTFHSPTGRNNQKGQNANADFLFFSTFTVTS